MSRPTVNMGLYGRILVDNMHEMFIPTDKENVYLTVYQTKAAQTLGSWVYDAAACLADYMLTDHFEENFCPNGLRKKTLIELGAGTGIVGLISAYHGSDVIVTDLEPLVPLMEFNIQNNRDLLKGTATAKPLPWGSECKETVPDILVLANCVYNECVLDALLQTTLDLTTPETLVMVCYEERTKEIKSLIERWHTMVAEHFDVVDVHEDDLPREHWKPFVRVAVLRKKSE